MDDSPKAHDAGPEQVGRLLEDWIRGDREALDQLTPIIYADLKRLAARHLRRERSYGSLQTTALVNEAYMRLAGNTPQAASRAHFLAIASRVMRRILVDRARTRDRSKRGGGAIALSLDEALVLTDNRSAHVLALDAVLRKLAEFDERKARVVEMRYFGGLEVAEVATALGVSENTVIRDWSIARAWLQKELSAPLQ